MTKNIILSAWGSLKRKNIASIFTIMTIALGMSMIVLLSSLYNLHSGNIGPYIKRDRTLYLENLSFEKNGETVTRDFEDASLNFLNKTIFQMQTPEMVSIFRIASDDKIGPKYNPFNIKVIDTDSNFWNIHRFHFISGRPFNSDEVDAKQRCCVISRKVALYYFGKEDVAGESLKLPKRSITVRIVGVINDNHPHFDVSADVYLPYTLFKKLEDIPVNYPEDCPTIRLRNKTTYPGRGHYKGIVVAPTSKQKELVTNEYNRIITKWNATGNVEEFDKVHSRLRSDSEKLFNLLFNNFKNLTLFYSCRILLIFIFILLPVIILSNINFYQLQERLEEIGIRKSFGATRMSIIRQFIFESIFITLFGTVFAFIIAVYLNDLLGYLIYQSTSLPGVSLNFRFLFSLIIGILAFAFLSIIIPVIRITKYNAVIALQRNSTLNTQVRTQKKWLKTITYFLLFLVLLQCSLLLVIPYRFCNGLGYDTQNRISIIIRENNNSNASFSEDFNCSNFKGLKEKLLRIDGVEQVASIFEAAPHYIYTQDQTDNFAINEQTKELTYFQIDSAFCKTLNISAHEGVLLKEDFIDNKYIPALTTIAGERAHFDGNAVGKIIKRTSDNSLIKIVGVIDKYKTRTIGNPFDGLFICRNRPSRSVVMKISSSTDLVKLNKAIINLVDNWPTGKMILERNENIDLIYQEKSHTAKTTFLSISFVTGLILLVAFLGFTATNYYNLKTKTHELGIRKTTGATKRKILIYLLREELVLVVIGSTLAILLSWQIFVTILNTAKEEIVSSIYLAVSLGLSMIIVSTLIPAIKASRIQPADALAEE
ncbi:ABC transporter permease [Puteibacter caeruleilacunae]|nr:ABC transporter permease [Puteibacter caeruleilacunae]